MLDHFLITIKISARGIELTLSQRPYNPWRVRPEEIVWGADLKEGWGDRGYRLWGGTLFQLIRIIYHFPPFPHSIMVFPSAASQEFSNVDVHKDLTFPFHLRQRCYCSCHFFRFSSSSSHSTPWLSLACEGIKFTSYNVAIFYWPEAAALEMDHAIMYYTPVDSQLVLIN